MGNILNYQERKNEVTLETQRVGKKKAKKKKKLNLKFWEIAVVFWEIAVVFLVYF